MAPSALEQGVLWAEVAIFGAGGVVLVVIAYVLNWKIAGNMGHSLVANLPGGQFMDGILKRQIVKWIDQWHDPERRVRRFATLWFAMAAFAIAFFSGMIALVLGTFVRDDGKESEWQRWIGFTVAFVTATIGMSEYYAVPLTDTAVWLIPLAVVGTLPGFAVSYLTGYAPGWAYFSIFGMVGLVGVFLVLVLRTDYSIYPKLYRGAPALLHSVVGPLVWWIILWSGPETNASDSTGKRAVVATAYLVFAVLWLVSDVLFLYLLRMGPPKVGTRATDAKRTRVVQDENGDWVPDTSNGPGGDPESGGAYDVVNTDPDSIYYDGGATPVRIPGGKPSGPATVTRTVGRGVHVRNNGKSMGGVY